MRTPRLALVLLLCVLNPAFLSAQQSTTPAPPPVASDPQAVALLQKSLVAMTGGLAVTDVTLTGTARRIAGSDDETGTATLKATSLGDSRIDFSFPSGNRTEIRNHSALPLPGALPPATPANIASQAQPAGVWSGPDGTRHAMANHNVLTDAAWFFPALALTNLALPNYVLTYIGQEAANGASVLHVSASQRVPAPSNLPSSVSAQLADVSQHLTQMDIYFDPTTSLPVALALNTHPDGNALIDIPVSVEFSNYQRRGAAQVPLHVQKFLNSGLVLDLELNEVTFNSGLGASPFQLQ